MDKELDYQTPVAPLPPPPVSSWPIGLAIALADLETAVGLGGSYGTEEDICKAFNISVEFLERLKGLKAFRSEVQEAIRSLKNVNGVIRRKAVLQLEQYIDIHIPNWLVDPNFPAPQKMDALKLLAKLGKLIDDPAAKNEQTQQGGSATQQPSINIILTNSTPMQSVQVTQNEPITIDQQRE